MARRCFGISLWIYVKEAMNLRHNLSAWLALAALILAGAVIACDTQSPTGAHTPTASDMPSHTADRIEPLPSATPTSVPLPEPGESPATPTPTEIHPTQVSTPTPTPTNTPIPLPTASPTPRPTESPTATLAPFLPPTSPPDPTSTPTTEPEPTQAPTSPPEPTAAPSPAPESTQASTPQPEPTKAPTPAPEPTQAPTPVPEPTEEPTPEPTEVPTTSSDVRIVCILFDGAIPRSEADEYVEISNYGGSQNLAGWVLKDRDDRRQEFAFPAYSLGPGDTIRVYTNQVHPQWGGLTFGSGTSLWNNTDADVAVLIDAQGRVVSSATYNTGNPPGCGG